MVVYEPRREYASVTEAIIKGGGYKLASARSLKEVKQIQKNSNIDLVIMDADLQVGEVGIFDVMYELHNIGLKGKVGLLIPSTLQRSRLMSLLASEPICLISRASLPSTARKSVEKAITRQRVIKPRYLSGIKKHSGKFANGSLETDEAYIAAGGGNVELYLLASKEAMQQGDSRRALSHLVSAFKLMPYSFTLYKRILANCHNPQSIYKLASSYLKNHPVSSPYFNGGAILAFVRLANNSGYSEDLQKLMDRRLHSLTQLK